MKAAGQALRFLVEVAVLSAYLYWGAHTEHTALPKLVVGLGGPVLAAVVWGVFGSPRARWRLHGVARWVMQAVFLGAAVWGLWATGHALVGVALLVAAAVSGVLGLAPEAPGRGGRAVS